MFNNLPTYQAVISDSNEGVFCVSLVTNPATEINFVYFDKDKKIQKFAIEDKTEHMVSGIIMVADTPIYRRTDDGYEYYMSFSKETLKLMAEKLIKDGFGSSVNIQHVDGSNVEGVNLTELYVIDRDKGIDPSYFSEAPDGSLVGTYKVNNDDVWQMIIDGEVLSFSLEGIFSMVETNFKKNYNKTKNTNSKMSKIKGILKSLLAEFGSIDTNKGVLDYEGELEVGAEVKINDEVAADGEYETDDKVIVVAEGKITEIRDKEAEEEPADEPKEDSVEFAKFKKIAQAYSETYAEKERKIYDAIKNATGVEYFWLVEAADDYAVYSIWVDDKDKYFRVELTWDEEGNVTVGVISEVEPAFVKKEDEKPAVEDVAMAEEPKADEPAEEPKEDEPKEDEPRDYGKEIDDLKAELDEIKKAIEEIKGKPANEPIAEEFEAISNPEKTGSRSMDKAIRRFSYLKK